MRILLITPAPPRSRKGNRVTALRWVRILRDLGHRVRIEQVYRREPCELMIALHARRSAASIRRFAERHPNLPLVVTLTGTDLYGDIRTDDRAKRSLELATRLILLQPEGLKALPKRFRGKACVILQSATAPAGVAAPRKDRFEVCVLGHLRPVKDPFRAAMAVRLLPSSSRLSVLHVGDALSERMARRAHRETASNPRYRWLGERPRWSALRVLARSRLLVLTSKMEGGANVVSEAIASRVPVLSTHIPGSVGLLGADYPAYFPVGDTRSLTALLWRCETDAKFYRSLQQRIVRLAPLFKPSRERKSWADLLRELRQGAAQFSPHR